MRTVIFLIALVLLPMHHCYAQFAKSDTVWVGVDKKGEPINKNVGHRSPASRLWADGFIVYKGDTMRGLIMMYSQFEILFQKVINEEYSYYYKFKKADPDLRTVMMYNLDKKPLCFTRIRPRDKKMMRVVHEGKLNIYDDRVQYIYKPGDIDKNLIMVSYDGVVDDLSSFFTENTKRDLIGYVNDIYGLHLNPKKLSWQQLLVEVDKLD